MIENLTRKTILCRHMERASSLSQKALGLMFRGSLKGGLLMEFPQKQRVGIWTLGMRFSIDILWLDRKGRVVHCKENAKPWRYLGFADATRVLEVRAGTLKKTRTQKGDTLRVHL